MKQQIIETWIINNRVNLMLIDAIKGEGMNCTLSKLEEEMFPSNLTISIITEYRDLKNMLKIY